LGVGELLAVGVGGSGRERKYLVYEWNLEEEEVVGELAE